MDKNPRQITRLRYLDARNLEKFVNSLTYESDTNTFEIGTNLYVDGIATAQYFAFHDSGDGKYLIQCNYENNQIEFLNDVDVYYVNLDMSEQSDILTSNNTKTLFGNQSLLKDPQHPENNNIDLYKHYLHIQGGLSGSGIYDFYIVIQSSSNIDCSSSSGATQKLKDLLKISGSTPRIYESGVCGQTTDEGVSSYKVTHACALYWDGSLLYARCQGAADYTIINIEDKVETV